MIYVKTTNTMFQTKVLLHLFSKFQFVSHLFKLKVIVTTTFPQATSTVETLQDLRNLRLELQRPKPHNKR